MSYSRVNFFLQWLDSPLGGLGRLIFRGFTITLFRHTTVGRTPLDEEPARRRDLYLTTHNTHKRQTSMPPVGFKPTILVSERPKTHVLDRTATGIGIYIYIYIYVVQNWGTWRFRNPSTNLWTWPVAVVSRVGKTNPKHTTEGYGGVAYPALSLPKRLSWD
jgi:hypothetical protein